MVPMLMTRPCHSGQAETQPYHDKNAHDVPLLVRLGVPNQMAGHCIDIPVRLIQTPITMTGPAVSGRGVEWSGGTGGGLKKRGAPHAMPCAHQGPTA